MLDNITVTDISPSLVSKNHTSEGLLVNSDGILYHFFRADTTEFSNHVSQAGKIVFRKSFNDGESWTAMKTIYDSEFDDRNIHGGIANGNIVIFFRRIDVSVNQSSYSTVDHNYLIFDTDFDQVISVENLITPTLVDDERGTTGTNKFFYVPDRGYFASFFNPTLNKIDYQFSSDGNNWNNGWMNAYNYSQEEYYLTENSFTYIGNNTIVGLARDGVSSSNGTYTNYYQLVSFDNGDSWEEPLKTNIDSGYYTPAPLIFLEENTQNVLCISTTRQTNQLNDHISVYMNKIDSVCFSPKGYKLVTQMNRPDPTEKRLYGY
ncbi:MAG: hypothetical protein QNK60_06950, partial [Flavobacteriales bacterium]